MLKEKTGEAAWEKVLRINVGAENGPVATIEELGVYAGLGGRAMTTTVVCKEVPPNCHPLGPENKLVFSPGLMAGSAAASSGRISVGCKSPLTGTIKESNSGGTGGQFMARLGYAAIILEGERKTDDLWKVVITKDTVTFGKNVMNTVCFPTILSSRPFRRNMVWPPDM